MGEHTAGLLTTLVVGGLFIRQNVRGAEVTGLAENVLTVSKLVILGVFIAYGLGAVVDAPDRAVQSFNPFFPQGFGGVIVAMGLTFIAFEGYDLIADQVIRHAPCDLALLKAESNERPRRCLFPTAGGPHARLAAEMLNTLAPAFGMSVTACYVVEPDADEQARLEAHRWIKKTPEKIEVDLEVEQKRYEGHVRSALKRAPG